MAGDLAVAGGRLDAPDALRDDRVAHEAVEVGPQRHAAVDGQDAADPAGDGGVPGAVDVAAGERGRRDPVGGGRRRRILAQLGFHPRDQPVEGLGALVRRQAADVPVDGGRPPVEQLIARPRSEGGDVVQDRFEQVGGGVVVLVEEQRLAEPDDQVEPVAFRQPRRVDMAQGRPRGGELGGVGGGPEPLQAGPADDQGGRRPDGVLDGPGGLDGLLEPALVVVGAGRRQGIGRDRRGRLAPPPGPRARAS